MENHYPYTLPALPYSYDALEPEIDSKTLKFHHDKHFATYVDNLNKLLENQPKYQNWTLHDLCMNWADLPDEIRVGVRNNAGGVYNHDLYFRTLQSLPPSNPQPPLEDAIERAFGDVDRLKKAFKSAALSVFGSGWACLCFGKNGELSIQKVANQNTVLPLTPLLCCDVWEHAYYLQYQNRRGEYFDAWWLLINWPEISRIYAEQFNNHLPIPDP